MTLACESLLIGATGSVGIVNMPQYIYKFRQAFANKVTVLMSRSAQKFIPPYTMELFSGNPVFTDTFDLVDVYSPLVYSVGMKYVGVGNESAVLGGLQAYLAQNFLWNQQTKYTSVSVQLRYDNTIYAETVKDRPPLSIPFYAKTVNIYKEVVNKDYVLFCSFNEWYETTSCEPSVEEDHKYLDLLHNLLP